MKGIVSLFVLLTLVFAAGQAMAEQTIRMGYFSLPPHIFSDGNEGQAKGAGVIYFSELAKKMGYRVEWVGSLPLPRLTSYLKSGENIDGMVGFPKFPVFEEFLHSQDVDFAASNNFSIN